MNEQVVVDKMIAFIENKVRELQVNKINADNLTRNDVVTLIMDELERETTNEDN